MNFKFRKGTMHDVRALKQLALKSWRQFEPMLTDENWQALRETLSSDKTYTELLNNSECRYWLYKLDLQPRQ